MSPRRMNATRADIIAMLRDGHSNSRIARDLRCDKTRVARLRIELGLPEYVPAEQTRTIEEKWALFARPVDGGHMEWTGERAKASSTPLLSYKEKHHSATAVAFRIRTGREPEGYVLAECGFKQCVAPDHVNDEAGRQQERRKIRAERGLGDMPEKCARGHDQAEHGRLEPDGVAYCEMCKVLDKRAQHADPEPGRRKPRGASLEEAFQRHSQPTEDGHVRWTGFRIRGTPALRHHGTNLTAYRVAFRLHYGRDPEGHTRPSCGMPQCVAGAHLEDRPMRQRTASLYSAIFGAAA